MTGVPAAAFDVEAGLSWTTSGGAGVDGVGSAPGAMVSTGTSGVPVWFMKTWVYWPAFVSASPICAVWLPLVVQDPRMLSRWPQHPDMSWGVHSRLVPPGPSSYIQAKSAESGVTSLAKIDPQPFG